MIPAPRNRILQILAAQALLRPEDLRLDARPEELGLDSLGLVEAIFAIEEAFDISIPFNAQEPGAGGFDTSTIGAVVAAIEALVIKG
ncbi:MAG: acyl carrier protein [Cypionkella sp.]